MTVLLLSMLTGCWKPYDELPSLDFDEVPYTNPYLQADDAVISAFDTTLACPDNSNARFFAVYRKGLTGKVPVAIVLHSGAFDYVVSPDPSDYLAGEHYQGTSRMDRSWAISKVWETLGINPNVVDSSEDNLGTLPAALTDAGFLTLYPGNCWGDLWHNEEGLQPNQTEAEGVDRNGRTFAWWMVRMLIETSFAGGQGFSVPVDPDTSQLYLVGLGDGGRGVAELLAHDDLPPVVGVLVDSSPDLLSAYVDDSTTFGDEVEGISRIFREENIDRVDDWSLYDVAMNGGLPDRVGYVWSATDPQVPEAATSPTADYLSTEQIGWVHDTHQAGHVFLNSDPDLTAAAVTYLQFGTIPQ